MKTTVPKSKRPLTKAKSGAYKKPLASIPMTAQECIDRMFQRVRDREHNASSYALGGLMVLCNLHLIDGPTYIKKGIELHEIETSQKGAQA